MNEERGSNHLTTATAVGGLAAAGYGAHKWHTASHPLARHTATQHLVNKAVKRINTSPVHAAELAKHATDHGGKVIKAGDGVRLTNSQRLHNKGITTASKVNAAASKVKLGKGLAIGGGLLAAASIGHKLFSH